MKRIVKNILSWHNPLSLFGIGGLAVVRGWGLIATGMDTFALGGYNNAPDLPGIGVALLGSVWLGIGLFMWVGMAVRRLFIPSIALMVGMYATWVVVHAIDLFTSPDWDSMTGLAFYLLMVPVTITLAAIEVSPPAEPSEGVD